MFEAVVLGAGEREERVAGRDLAAVGGEAADFHRGRRGTVDEFAEAPHAELPPI